MTEQDAATSLPAQARDWLEHAAVPGRTTLRLAATCQALETVFSVVGWATLAWIAGRVLDHRAQPTWPVLAVLPAAGLLAAGAALAAARCKAVGRQRIGRAIRRRLVAAMLPTGRRRGEPDPATAALAIVESADDVADYHAQALPERLSAPASMAVIFLVTAAVQWPAAAILLLASLLVPLNMRLAGRFATEGADERVAASARLAAVVLDSFRGMRTLRGIGALARRRGELADAAAELNAATMAVVRRAFLSGAVMDVVITFSIAVNATYIGLSLLGYVRLPAAPPTTLAGALLALLLCPMYFQPLRAMAAAYHNRERATSAVPTIMALLADTDTMPETTGRTTPSPAGPVTVVLDDVAFRFPHAERPVLHRARVTFDAGCWTAVVGPSGIGKTTLLSLIAGMRSPSTGTIRWVSPADVSQPHLGGCAWIGQQTVLLPGTIRDNIRLGRPAAGPVDVERAVAAAGLAEVVARLPGGLDTPLGERGLGLSTGEARRIAIARAFLSDAELWVIDEPTAHLDPDAEAQIIAALRTATKGRTVIVATHSAAVARCADTVLGILDGTTHTVREATPA
ncbi:thiol reductant ABC exporter subunit CydD [Actinoallomurus vinaceus]|uniref:Thiol reductant ABC exporter subunit CydD n=1 Tax=Actinoallomurus vinaceus TaxID=1080074 RepID=A0ABP8UPG7_9ACTN